MHLDVEIFKAQQNTQFQVNIEDDEPIMLKLVEVKDLRKDTNDDKQAFSLIFQQKGREAFLPQQMVRMQHDDLGQLDVFMVPIADHEDGIRYEVIFN